MEPARLSRLEHAARLACGLMLIAGIIGAIRDARAQQVQVEAISEAVTGHAPVIAIGAIANESVPSRPPATGHALRASASVTDPDLDAIASTTYRWLRNGTEVAAGPAYTTTAEDVAQGLSVEVSAATDAAITEPASATQSTTVAVIANSAPTATPTITGTVATNQTLTGHTGFADAEFDVEGTHAHKWYRADDATGTVARVQVGSAATYTVAAADQGKFLVYEVVPASSTGQPNTGVAAQVVTVAAVPFPGPPVAADVAMNGLFSTAFGPYALVGNELSSTYRFSDPDNDPEDTSASGTSVTWCRAGTCNVSTQRNYTVQPADFGATIGFEVIPRATMDPKAGTAVRSATQKTMVRSDVSNAPITIGSHEIAWSADHHVMGHGSEKRARRVYVKIKGDAYWQVSPPNKVRVIAPDGTQYEVNSGSYAYRDITSPYVTAFDADEQLDGTWRAALVTAYIGPPEQGVFARVDGSILYFE